MHEGRENRPTGLHLLTAGLGLMVLLLVAAGSGQYTPPHARPGPAVDRVYFRSFHVDLAPASIQAGDMDLYFFSLKTETAAALARDPKVWVYESPASMVSLILNPAPAPQGELNPFSLKKVRQALQYAVNRDFIAQEIYKGLARPMLTWVSPFDFDYLTVSDLLREQQVAYDPDLAKAMVTEAMEAAGARLADGRWQYNDRPVQLKFIIRVEDERREIGDTVRAELERLGFSVISIYQEFAPAVQKVYSTDPQLFEWHLYTEGWGRGSAERYDYGTANQMAAPWLGNMPGWQELGFWQYQHPELDEKGQRLFRGDFQNVEERNQLYREMVRLGLEESVRVWVITQVNSFPSAADLQGVTVDLVAGPKSLGTLRDAYRPGKDTLTVGHLWVETPRTVWNPVGGFGDVYSVDIWRYIYDPPLARHPFSGLPIPFRVSYQVETRGPTGKLDVPAEAVLWDARAKAFRPVGAGVRAISKVTFDFSQYFQTQWHHGQPITMADVLYLIYQRFDMAQDENKARIETALAATSRPYLETIRGLQVLDESRLEVYVDYWHFVDDYIAEYASPGGPTMPWEILAAMDRLVFQERRAAYSSTAAQRFNVPWISLVTRQHARLVRNALRAFQDEEAFPEDVFRVNGLSLATRQEALSRYAAAIAWIEGKDYLAVISNGPFQLVRFDPAAQFAELEAFRDPTYPFKPGDHYYGAAEEITFTAVEAPRAQPGTQEVVKVELAGPGTLALRYQLFDPAQGNVMASGEAERSSPTRFQITLPPEVTARLAPGGLFHLFLTAYSDALASPSERRLDLEVGPEAPATGTPGPAEEAGGGAGLVLILAATLGSLAAFTVIFLLLLLRRAKKAS